MNIVERFISYTKINTTTDREGCGRNAFLRRTTRPCETAGQELEALGVEDIKLRDTAIVTATLPSILIMMSQPSLSSAI